MPANAATISSLPAHRRPSSPLAPDAATLERFLAHCHRRRYPPRTDVFRPGDPASTLYYTAGDGMLVVYHVGASGPVEADTYRVR